MHDIIEHYGKVIVALAGALAAVLLTATVVGKVQSNTLKAIGGLEYESAIHEAVNTPASASGAGAAGADAGDTP